MRGRGRWIERWREKRTGRESERKRAKKASRCLIELKGIRRGTEARLGPETVTPQWGLGATASALFDPGSLGGGGRDGDWCPWVIRVCARSQISTSLFYSTHFYSTSLSLCLFLSISLSLSLSLCLCLFPS